MIITTDALASIAGKPIVMVDGIFDPLHNGHIANFTAAQRIDGAVYVLCNITSDSYLKLAKGRPPLVPETQRAVVIDSLSQIDYVHLAGELSTVEVLRLLRPTVYAKGCDWEGKLPQDQIDLCAELGIKIVYLDTVVNSSTELVKAYTQALRRQDFEGQVDEFEAYIAAHPPFGPEHYDKKYFMGDWRANDNSYDLEKRREIEGQNPANIMRVFEPLSVLDWGCGPGTLMHFLHELGADVYGVDFSEEAKADATDEVRDRIAIGPIDCYKDFEKDFDLVVCREVIEHLTVPQTMGMAYVLCVQYRPRFVYLTTRYHSDPDSLLSVMEDDPSVDPSHINLTNKQWLRSIFVAHGYRTRKDLEKELDWKNFGRVIALERND